MILYLHGFRSGPESWKARRLAARMAELGLADRLWSGQLPVSPRDAIALAERALAAADAPVTVVGSSLGGFYATHLAEKHGLRAVVVNPAVLAPLSLAAYVGPQTHMYTGETFEFTPAHVEALRALQVGRITRPERYWLLAETGDEVLDYRHAEAFYAGARQTVLEGGDHSFTRWDDHLDGILAFAGLVPAGRRGA